MGVISTVLVGNSVSSGEVDSISSWPLAVLICNLTLIFHDELNLSSRLHDAN